MTNFASANVDDVLVTPGDLVITADGTFPLAPGDYVAVGRVDDEVVTDEVPFTIEACPTPTPTATTPGGGVEGETATPAITAPPTDALGGSGPTSGGDTWRIVLIGFGALIGGAMVITSNRNTGRKATNRKR